MNLFASADCPFCRVVRGEADSDLVFEDGISLAFLDTRPLFPGHCLLVPREHLTTLHDLPPELIGPFFANVQLISTAVEQAMEAEGTFVGINNRVSQSVAHMHVHIVPRRKGDGLRGFFWPRQRYGDRDEATRIQELIRAAVSSLQPGTP